MDGRKIKVLVYTALSCGHREVFILLQKKYGFTIKCDNSYEGNYYLLIGESYFYLCSYWDDKGMVCRRWGGA